MKIWFPYLLSPLSLLIIPHIVGVQFCVFVVGVIVGGGIAALLLFDDVRAYVERRFWSLTFHINDISDDAAAAAAAAPDACYCCFCCCCYYYKGNHALNVMDLALALALLSTFFGACVYHDKRLHTFSCTKLCVYTQAVLHENGKKNRVSMRGSFVRSLFRLAVVGIVFVVGASIQLRHTLKFDCR